MIDDDTCSHGCELCGRGSVFSDALFTDGDRLIHWTMWSCGHSARRVQDERVPAWSRDVKRRPAALTGQR